MKLTLILIFLILTSCSNKIIICVKDLNQVHYTDSTIIIEGPAVIKPAIK